MRECFDMGASRARVTSPQTKKRVSSVVFYYATIYTTRRYGGGYTAIGRKSWLFPLLPVACWSAPSTSRLCRGHFADSPSLTLGTILSAVDDMVCSPKPTFAALAVAAQASDNTHELTSTVVHDTAAQVTRPRTPPPTHRPTLAPTTHMGCHMHTTDHRSARYKAATCGKISFLPASCGLHY